MPYQPMGKHPTYIGKNKIHHGVFNDRAVLHPDNIRKVITAVFTNLGNIRVKARLKTAITKPAHNLNQKLGVAWRIRCPFRSPNIIKICSKTLINNLGFANQKDLWLNYFHETPPESVSEFFHYEFINVRLDLFEYSIRGAGAVNKPRPFVLEKSGDTKVFVAHQFKHFDVFKYIRGFFNARQCLFGIYLHYERKVG